MIPGTFCPHDFDQACMACINAAIEQARNEEREECAKLCDSLRSVIVDDALVPAAPGHCAAAIRARKP